MIIFKCREAPGVRWACIDDNNGGGQWCWLCDECGKTVNEPGHFTSPEHMRQRKQTHIDKHMDG
eukprot:1662305-Pyramimonas_sp.AAC.1